MNCTYCSADKRKTPGSVPAVERYISARIGSLHARGPLLILSGEYGLLQPHDLIPWYDHLLVQHEVSAMVPLVVGQLTALGIPSLRFHTADPSCTPAIRPYVALIKQACEAAGVALELQLLKGSPP